MEKYLEIKGRSEDEAIEEGLAQLKLERDDVSVEILQRAKKGFLGIGSSPAVVKLSYNAPDEKPAPVKKEVKQPSPQVKKGTAKNEKQEAPKASVTKTQTPVEKPVAQKPAEEKDEYAEIRSFLEGLFQRMGVKADIEIGPREGGGTDVKLSGNGIGSIIGRRGETLDAIQHLTNYAVNHGSDKRMHINVDAEGYRSKREDSLVHLAEKMAEKAIKYKRSMALEPMNSYERHVIHTALQDYEGVTTASTGEEPNRRVVVTPVKADGQKSSGGRPSKPAKQHEAKKEVSPVQTTSVETKPEAVDANETVEAVTPPRANKPKSREWA